MHILAWIVVVVTVMDILTQPARFGQERIIQTYSFWTWVLALADAAILLPLCGRVLGWW